MKMTTGLLLFLAGLVSGEQSISVWNGVYTADQATRGKVIYGEQCATCHGEELAGKNGPALTGTAFKENWNGLTADDLFEYIKTSMPRGQTGRLTRDQTANIVGFLLTSNGFPAGNKELPIDAKALQGISFDSVKPGVESTKPK